jgi:hypothetical protein
MNIHIVPWTLNFFFFGHDTTNHLIKHGFHLPLTALSSLYGTGQPCTLFFHLSTTLSTILISLTHLSFTLWSVYWAISTSHIAHPFLQQPSEPVFVSGYIGQGGVQGKWWRWFISKTTNCLATLGVVGELGGFAKHSKIVRPPQAASICVANHNLLSFEFKSQASQVQNYISYYIVVDKQS